MKTFKEFLQEAKSENASIVTPISEASRMPGYSLIHAGFTTKARMDKYLKYIKSTYKKAKSFDITTISAKESPYGQASFRVFFWVPEELEDIVKKERHNFS